MNSPDSKIVVIMAGGFIAEKYEEKVGFTMQISTIETIESIKNEINLNIEISEFSLIDSCSADLQYFLELAKVVQRKINCHFTKGKKFFF